MKTQTRPLIKLTCQWSDKYDGYRPISRFSLHDRINYKVTDWAKSNQHINANYSFYYPTYTKEQRYDNYVCNCLERDLRPFGYNDELWEEHLREIGYEKSVSKIENEQYLYMYGDDYNDFND